MGINVATLPDQGFRNRIPASERSWVDKQLYNQPDSKIKQVQGRESNMEGQDKEPGKTNI